MLLDCKSIAKAIKTAIREDVSHLDIKPKLAIIHVGSDNASEVYVRGKVRDCEECGIDCNVYRFTSDISECDLCTKIMELNYDDTVTGILVQLPLPDHIRESEVMETISPYKDVDGFNPINIGDVITKGIGFEPCTPLGIIKVLEYYNIPIEGKTCVVVGRSNIVGKPIARMLLDRNGTVIQCHSKTTNLAEMTRQADILISAVGKPNFITKDMVKRGAVVIDVGINRNQDNKLCGDVDFDEVSEVAEYITPVPGGIGLMTRACLMFNVLKACK